MHLQAKFYAEAYLDFIFICILKLKKLISMGKGIELNTGGYHYGLGEPNPCVGIIRRYRELGGEIITIGADAHTPDKAAYAFDRAEAVLDRCGFRYYTVFKEHKPEFLPL